MKKILWFGLLCLWSIPLSVFAQDVPRYEVTPCPFFMPYEDETEGETLECGTLTVPEDHADPAGKTIELAVVIVYSTSEDPYPDPVIYLEGGPGGAALSAYDSFLRSTLRTDRNLILLDQRGTGYSQPSLNCWEYGYDRENPALDCYNRLVEADVNLAAYHSAQSALDVADLISVLGYSVLGYDEVNLWGISYGTRLALTIMRDTDAPIRSVILDGVYPPQVLAWNENASNGYAAFQILFDNCVANDDCNEAYPDLETLFADTVTALDAEPMPLVDEDENETGEELTGQQLVNNLYRDLYDSSMIRYLPAKIYAASIYDAYNYTFVGWDDDSVDDPPHIPGVDLTSLSEDEYHALWKTYLGYDTSDDLLSYLESLDEETYESQRTLFETAAADSNGALVDASSEGFYNTVECYEEIPFNSLEAGQQLLNGVPENIQTALLETFTVQVHDCGLWDLPQASAFENEIVVSELPVLVMSGEYDPVTPPSWAKSTADALPNSFNFVMPGMGHGVIDIGNACPTDITLAFLDDPQTPPDASCIDDMATEFYIGDF
jgi:pimeloyl-ACP methyl ester carboxylesterase